MSLLRRFVSEWISLLRPRALTGRHSVCVGQLVVVFLGCSVVWGQRRRIAEGLGFVTLDDLI